VAMAAAEETLSTIPVFSEMDGYAFPFTAG
jgi:hypothetical protein